MSVTKKKLSKKDLADIEAGNIPDVSVSDTIDETLVVATPSARRAVKKKPAVLSHGEYITCAIEEELITDARISIDKDGTIHVVHNNVNCDGSMADDMLGYEYSWCLGETSDNIENIIEENQIIKIAPAPIDEVVTPEEQKPFSIVDTFNPDHIQVLESAIALNNPVLLVGHTGLGKTTLLAELAKRHGKKLVRLSVHSGVTADEILGKWLAENGSTIWQDGLLIQAMKNDDWIVFDEINACPADVMFALHSLLDDDRHVTLLEKRGEVVKPQEGFRFFATMNPQDDYAGTKEVNMAFMSRFNAVIEIEPYDHSIEVQILVSKGLKKDTAEKLVSTANKLRAMKFIDEIIYFCGTRDIINTGLMVDGGVDIGVAMKYGIFNKMNNDDKAFVKGKIPDFNYKSKEQLKIEGLEANIRSKDAQLSAFQTTVKTLEEKLANATGGNTTLDANTIKALKILKVLK